MGRPPCSEKGSELKRGPWTQEEDQKLMDYISKNGYGNWRTLPKNAGLSRCGKSCRLRWTNYLRPDIKRGRFSMEEEYTIIHLHSLLGNKWSTIASHLPGRTDNEIKNYWNTHIRKRLTQMGIDPVTHTLRLDLLDQALSNPALQLNRNLDAELLMLANNLTSATQYNQNINMLDNSFNPHQNLQEIPNFDMKAVEDQPQMQEPSYCTHMGLDGYDQFVGDQLISNNNNLFIQDGVVGSGIPSMPNFNFASGIPSTTTLSDFGGQFDQMDPTLYDCPLLITTSCSQNFNFGSFLSTPASSPSTNLNSTSTFINSSIAEDDRDSFCNSDLSFQVQQLLEANDFL